MVPVFPAIVIGLTFLPEFAVASDQARFIMGCFGAQTVLTGTLMLTACFTPMAFLAFGLVGSIPFFAFNNWFVFVEPVLNQWMLLDFVGNVRILVPGIWAWWLSKQEQHS